MTYSWKTCPSEIRNFVTKLLDEIKVVIQENYIGCYIHGSLAMGGFNPSKSDIDLLVVTRDSITSARMKELVQLFLDYSGNPYPVEISFLNKDQLTHWQHPCPFDFHYSEYWREYYESESRFFSVQSGTDPDLAAHIMIINHRGCCLEGRPISDVFPVIPYSDYIDSIMGDFRECQDNMVEDPIYCSLNLIRVYLYLKDRKIFSKLEAGNWALESLPDDTKGILKKVISSYTQNDTFYFDQGELLSLKNFLVGKIEMLQK
ncbi:DUF4111 domain-containing protein [Virgibacillus siamensis]|uniref:Spectinomycin 9-adenylyltransferase n=1 Tax=Virgibacillus siamensis TaxID=480071 RepID=A0ABP3RMY0_9BACI